MGSIKQKEQVSDNPDDQVWVKPLMKSRKQQLAEKYERKTLGNYDDIKPMLQKMKAQIVNQVETLPKGDYETYSKNDWKILNDKNSTYNRRSGTTKTWH